VRWGAAAAAVGIIFYTLLVGANPSVVRAAIMGCLGLSPTRLAAGRPGSTAWPHGGRDVHFNPNLPWDVSFQLTFMATLACALCQPFQDAFERLAARFPCRTRQRCPAHRRTGGEYFLFPWQLRWSPYRSWFIF